MTATSRARAVLGAVAATVTIAILGACTPLDGRSVSVEVAVDPAPEGAGRIEIPWWVTTTTASTTTVAPQEESAPIASTPDLAAVTPTPEPAPAAPVTAPTTIAPPPPAPPVRPVTERDRVVAAVVSALGSPSSREIATTALGLVRFDWITGLPGWQLRFGEGRPGVRGLTFPDRRIIEVYVRSSDSPELLAHVIAHELGHAVDVTRFDDVQRAAWLAARGYGGNTIWFPGESGVSDFATGAGDFAESFAWVHGPAGHWSGELGPPPNLVQAGILSMLSGTA